jgi:hypothetical protein
MRTTTKDDIQKMLDAYWTFLKKRTNVSDYGEWFTVYIPYEDRHNDCLEIYISEHDGSFILTDAGLTMQDLVQTGCDMALAYGKFNAILNGFGVTLNGDELRTRATAESFSERLHCLVHAMLYLNGMFHPPS